MLSSVGDCPGILDPGDLRGQAAALALISAPVLLKPPIKDRKLA